MPTDVPVDDGDTIRVGHVELTARHLVGHTPGSIALVYDDPHGHPHVFTGDCLFPGGVGNTRKDPKAFASLIHDVETKIFDALPDETWVYPGHGNDTIAGRRASASAGVARAGLVTAGRAVSRSRPGRGHAPDRPGEPSDRAGAGEASDAVCVPGRRRAPCERSTHAGATHALPAHGAAQSTGSSPAQDDGSCAVRAAGLSIPALGRRPRLAAVADVRRPPPRTRDALAPHEFTTLQHPFPLMRTVAACDLDKRAGPLSLSRHASCPTRACAVAASTATVALLAIAVGCAPQPEEKAADNPPVPAREPCAKGELGTEASGKLTIATDEPAYEPWFKDDKPANGEGFESAVAYAVAKQLGYDKGDVVWQSVPFNKAFAPGEKTFDFDINQVSISDERKKAVDFSSGYYDVRQAVIALKDSKAAKAKSIADLKGVKLGAQVGTTSLELHRRRGEADRRSRPRTRRTTRPSPP